MMCWEPEDKILPIKVEDNWHYFPNQCILIWCGPRKDSESQAHALFYLPEYNKPSFSLFNNDYSFNLEASHFFYHNDNFLIFQCGNPYGSRGDYTIWILKINGDLHQELIIKMTDYGIHFKFRIKFIKFLNE